jgi:3'-phosphoadenosine 5'-phosphosulfate (PAPS) 3'-phosphatase
LILDGTKAFRAGDPDFTVNIALIDGDTPVLGVVYAPAHADGYVGVVGGAAYRFRDDDDRDVQVTGRPLPRRGLTVLTSTSGPTLLDEQLMAHIKIDRHIKRRSSIKYTEVARGTADLALTTRGVWYWDSAAADAVLRAAGGVMIDINGATLRYDRTREIWENHGVMATMHPEYLCPILAEWPGQGWIRSWST